MQELLDELDEQKAQLEEQLKEVRKKCAEEAQLVKPGCLLTLLPLLSWLQRKHPLLVSSSLVCSYFMKELELLFSEVEIRGALFFQILIA